MSDAPARCRVWLRRGCGALAHLAAWGMTVFLLLLSRPGTSLFSWHPVFMSIAFCLCLTEALLIFSPEASLVFCSHKAKVQLHWIAQMLALVAATLGLVFIISSKNRSELPHFISWHSILGLVTILATCGQVLCGLGLLFPQLLRISLAAQLWRCHTVYGLIVYLLATSTVVLGICSDWFQAQIKGMAWYLCLGLIFCPALIIMNQISRTCLSKKRQYV
ncbi:cytochrome b561 domain-containing protein 1-like [Pseudonaja textilis]|uniref:cytochrome b561 domain-containing protein 1-like n=1 Tax=Pseudonaja textilis TaxID=8673 RepID=UPI000EA8ABA1|nr:cytochrome b561 domain-containing protein 1-like [Pseudonaja textilis]XP_026573928.1 cytochrome b561 domain-containing protein 1-like [Pseudonaja textilis]